MLLPQKGTRELRSVGLPLVQICSLSPRSDLVLQPLSLTSCCLCFGWVNLHSGLVARATAKVGGLAAGVHVLPRVAWAPATWTPPALLGKSAGNSLGKNTAKHSHPVSHLQPEYNDQVWHLVGFKWDRLDCSCLCCLLMMSNKAKNGVIWLWEKSLRKCCQTARDACLFLEVCSRCLVMFFYAWMYFWLYHCMIICMTFLFVLPYSACQLKALDLCLEPTNVFARLDSIIPTSSQWTAFRVSAFAWVQKKKKRKKQSKH